MSKCNCPHCGAKLQLNTYHRANANATEQAFAVAGAAFGDVPAQHPIAQFADLRDDLQMQLGQFDIVATGAVAALFAGIFELAPFVLNLFVPVAINLMIASAGTGAVIGFWFAIWYQSGGQLDIIDNLLDRYERLQQLEDDEPELQPGPDCNNRALQIEILHKNENGTTRSMQFLHDLPCSSSELKHIAQCAIEGRLAEKHVSGSGKPVGEKVYIRVREILADRGFVRKEGNGKTAPWKATAKGMAIFKAIATAPLD